MAYLVLSNGMVFEGTRFGAAGDATGELVFTTGMTGYVETLTDPSYAGQIVMQTFPLIGNYGVMREDFEGESALGGYVVREYCDEPSNFRSQLSLDAYLKEKNIPGICGIDTRDVTKILREEGVMNAIICDTPPADLTALRDFRIENPVRRVSRTAPQVFEPQGAEKFRISLIDYGAKRNIIRSLTKRGCRVTALPCTATAAEVLAGEPDGVMLSNGPGDPADNTFCIEQIRGFIGKVPVFGICLGHQLTALALGGKTVKLKYGHRGANQPVTDLQGGRTYISCQNHGYAVLADSLSGTGRETFRNPNDGSCEGMEYPGLDCFTVQFHPEAHGGPHDTGFLIDRFLTLCEAHRKG